MKEASIITKDDSVKYHKDGYLIKRGFYDQKDIINLSSYVDGLLPNIFVPFSDEALGYGNLLEDTKFDFLYKNSVMDKFFLDTLETSDIAYNHLIVHNKPAWVGLGHEWHQESANISSFAPGCAWKSNWKDFMQVIIPLDSQNLENGCMKLIPKTHTLGLLEHENFVSNHFAHKRRITPDALNHASEKFGIVDCSLMPGDVLFFNHLIAHASTNNNSNKRRRSIVIQVRKDTHRKCEKTLNEELDFRLNFAIDGLKKHVSLLENNRRGFYGEVTKYTTKKR